MGMFEFLPLIGCPYRSPPSPVPTLPFYADQYSIANCHSDLLTCGGSGRVSTQTQVDCFRELFRPRFRIITVIGTKSCASELAMSIHADAGAADQRSHDGIAVDSGPVLMNSKTKHGLEAPIL